VHIDLILMSLVLASFVHGALIFDSYLSIAHWMLSLCLLAAILEDQNEKLWPLIDIVSDPVNGQPI
jgi:hypothetical protein